MSFGYLHKHIAAFALLILIGFLGLIGGGSYFLYAQNHKTVAPQQPTNQNDTETLGAQTTAAPSEIQSQANITKPVAAGEVCSQRSIPYVTNTQYEASLTKGQSYNFGGYNGTEYYCTNKAGVKRITATIPPIDKITHIGTGEPYTYTPPASTTPTTPITPQYTYAQAYSLAQSNCSVLGTGNSSAWQQCIDAYLHKFGY